MWPNLFRVVRPGQQDQAEQRPILHQVQENNEVDINVNGEEILKEFKNLYWTRIIEVDQFESGLDRKFNLGPDLIEECRAITGLDSVDPDNWKPLFNPSQFNADHGPLKIDQYRLNPDLLRYWAEKCTQMRKEITERAKLAATTET